MQRLGNLGGEQQVVENLWIGKQRLAPRDWEAKASKFVRLPLVYVVMWQGAVVHHCRALWGSVSSSAALSGKMRCYE